MKYTKYYFIVITVSPVNMVEQRLVNIREWHLFNVTAICETRTTFW